MTRWRVIPSAADIVIRETDWSASFECHNVDSGAMVKVELTQTLKGPVTDLIGALQATAKVLHKAARVQEADEDEPPARMH
jgi:hypothetical protein